jgi:hypothetical protein
MSNIYPVWALSVRQPWAWAIIDSTKDVENRSPAAIRNMPQLVGRTIAIHASSGNKPVVLRASRYRVGISQAAAVCAQQRETGPVRVEAHGDLRAGANAQVDDDPGHGGRGGDDRGFEPESFAVSTMKSAPRDGCSIWLRTPDSVDMKFAAAIFDSRCDCYGPFGSEPRIITHEELAAIPSKEATP